MNEYGREEQGRGGYGGRGGHRGGHRGHGGHGHERRGIPLSALDEATTEASRKLIGAAIEVHKTLGPGHDHATYVNALRAELDAMGVAYKQGHVVPVMYRDRKVGEGATDLFIDGRFFAEVLARPGAVSTFERLALRAKLKSQDIELGLIINFGERRLKDGLVRVVNIDKLQKEKGLALEDDEGAGEHESDAH